MNYPARSARFTFRLSRPTIGMFRLSQPTYGVFRLSRLKTISNHMMAGSKRMYAVVYKMSSCKIAIVELTLNN